LEFRSLGTGGVADPRYISLYCLPDICYHVKFGSSATKGVCINNKERQKLGSAGTPPLWGGGVADHPNTSPICVTTSNLVVRRQLQQPTGWCQQPIATKAPSHPERCRSSCYRSQKIRAYDAHPTWSSLAAGSTADHVQDSSSGLQVSARHGSTVPSDILWADVNSCHPASSIRSLRPTDCSTHQNKLRRPQFRRPRTSCMEQSSCCTASTRHYTDNVQEQTEDIFVQRVTVHTAHLQLSSDFALYKCS